MAGDAAVGSGGRHIPEVDRLLLGQPTGGGRGPYLARHVACNDGRGGGSLGDAGSGAGCVGGRGSTGRRVGVGVDRRLLAHLLAGLHEHLMNEPGLLGRDIDRGLLRLDGGDDLADLDPVSGPDGHRRDGDPFHVELHVRQQECASHPGPSRP
jgi:hypothetical protein